MTTLIFKLLRVAGRGSIFGVFLLFGSLGTLTITKAGSKLAVKYLWSVV